MDINERAMLIKLSITQWSARRGDKQATATVASAYGTVSDAGRYNKRLVSPDATKPIEQTANAARTYHYTHTLPWTDEGWRILPSAEYLNYTAEMRKLESQFRAAVADFVNDYPQHQAAAAVALNGLYRAEEYPPAAALADKYTWSIEVSPIPAAADFRVALDSEQTDIIRARITDRVTAGITAAVADLYQRIKDAVSHAAEKFAEPDAIFRDSLITNLADLADLLPRLNLTNDPALAAIGAEIRATLADRSPDHLRRSPAARRQAAEQARAILDKMAGLMGGAPDAAHA